MTVFKGVPNYKPMGSTFDANHLERILFDNNKIESFKSSKPRYVGNEDIFQKVPYVQPKLNTSRNDNSMNSSYQDN